MRRKLASLEPTSYFSYKDRIESIPLLLEENETLLSLSFHYFESGLTLINIFPPVSLPETFAAGQLSSKAFVTQLEGEEKRAIRTEAKVQSSKVAAPGLEGIHPPETWREETGKMKDTLCFCLFRISVKW